MSAEPHKRWHCTVPPLAAGHDASPLTYFGFEVFSSGGNTSPTERSSVATNSPSMKARIFAGRESNSVSGAVIASRTRYPSASLRSSAEYFTVVDRGDDAGLARRLEPEMRRVNGYGPSLADGLAHLLRDLTAAETAAAQAKTAFITSQRELDATILNLQGAVAQGRAVLATLGVKVSRKIKKKAEPVKPVVAVVPEAA